VDNVPKVEDENGVGRRRFFAAKTTKMVAMAFWYFYAGGGTPLHVRNGAGSQCKRKPEVSAKGNRKSVQEETGSQCKRKPEVRARGNRKSMQEETCCPNLVFIALELKHIFIVTLP
jgi:hypothetical protein